jgi:hypothetical protein
MTADPDEFLRGLADAVRDFNRRADDTACVLLAEVLDEHGIEIEGVNA